jgi:hypothetical protein
MPPILRSRRDISWESQPEMRPPFSFATPFRSEPAAPELVAWLALLWLIAVWAARLGPAPPPPLLWTGTQALVWCGLYIGLAWAYGAGAPHHGQASRRVVRRLAGGLFLAVLATHSARLLLSTVAPALWTHTFYLRFLIPAGFLCAGCAALLPRDTSLLVRAARNNATIAPLPALSVFLVAAALLVSCADIALQVYGKMPVVRSAGVAIGQAAWVTNCLILFSAFTLAFVLSSRMALGMLLVAPPYLALGFATLIKIHYMHSAVQPLDLLRLPEFLPLYVTFLGRAAAVAAVAATALWAWGLAAASRGAPVRVPAGRRLAIGLVSLLVLLAFPVAFVAAPRSPRVAALLHRVGAPDVWQWKEQAIVDGFLLSFISELPSLRISAPPHYTPAAIAQVLRRYWRPRAAVTGKAARPGVNVILYLVESFVDPNDLGVRYTAEPMPNVRAFRNTDIGGHAIVPEEFGGSANTEFEALTGMTMAFLPSGSLPYRQYLRHPVPSLPFFLRSRGYTTTAVQPDSRFFYDRERAYRLLGFDRVVWLDEVPGIQRDPRVDWPTDRAVVDAVINASRGPRPFFVFAFPSSTHSPYTSGAYKGSSLNVVDAPRVDSAGEIKEYVNALHVADRDIGALVRHFSRQTDSTLIVVLGDHLPPLSQEGLRPFWGTLSHASRAQRDLMVRRVPLLVWANFHLPRETPELSVNALPSYILNKIGLAEPPLLAVTDSIRLRLPVLGRYMVGAQGQTWDHDSLPDSLRALVRDYQLLQYDLLLGRQYAVQYDLSGGKPGARPHTSN